jgi:hypothetical protein
MPYFVLSDFAMVVTHPFTDPKDTFLAPYVRTRRVWHACLSGLPQVAVQCGMLYGILYGPW